MKPISMLFFLLVQNLTWAQEPALLSETKLIPKSELVDQRAKDLSTILALQNAGFIQFEDDGSLKRSAENACTLPGIKEVHFLYFQAGKWHLVSASKASKPVLAGPTLSKLKAELSKAPGTIFVPSVQWTGTWANGICRIDDEGKNSWVSVIVDSAYPK